MLIAELRRAGPNIPNSEPHQTLKFESFIRTVGIFGSLSNPVVKR